MSTSEYRKFNRRDAETPRFLQKVLNIALNPNLSLKKSRLIKLASLTLRLCVSAVIFSMSFQAVAAQRNSLGWAWQNPLPQGNPLYAIHFAKDKLNGYTVGSDNTILHTTNGGFRWEKQFSETDVTFSDVWTFDEDNAIIVGARGTIISTSNGGKTWKQVASDTRDHLYSVDFASDGKTGYASGTYGRVIKSTDGGITWKTQPTGSDKDLLRISAFDATRSVAVGLSGTVLTTVNGGGYWASSAPCGNVIVSSAAFLSQSTIVVAGYDGCVARSIDSGATWSRAELYSHADMMAIAFSDERNGSMTDSNGCAWMTGDGGVTWLPFSVRTNPKLVALYFGDNFTGWAVGDSGTILKTTTGGVLTNFTNTSSEIPDKYFLSQNYPNPFNPVTNLEFGISELEFVSLKIFDVLGNEVSTLVNENKPAGRYEVTFNGADFPSGVYFVRMESGDFMDVKRMVLIK